MAAPEPVISVAGVGGRALWLVAAMGEQWLGSRLEPLLLKARQTTTPSPCPARQPPSDG